MECFWDKNDLEKAKQELDKMIENETDLSKKAFLLRVLDSTNNLLFLDDNKCPSCKVDLNYGLYQLKTQFIYYYSFYCFIMDFYNSFLDFIEEIDRISDYLDSLYGDKDVSSLTGATLSKDKALSMLDEFYKGFDDDIYGTFKPIFDERKSTLAFRELTKKTKGRETDGNCLFIGGLNRNYIEVFDTNFLDVYHTLVHEYGHAVGNIFSPELVYADDSENFFAEVPSIFPELVSMYESSSIDSLFNFFKLIVEYFNYANSLVMHKVVLEKWDKYKKDANFRFFREMKKEFNFNKKETIKLLDTSMESEGTYVISFMISLELLHIYREDKKKALELYKQILSFDNPNKLWQFLYSNMLIGNKSNEEVHDVVKKFTKRIIDDGGQNMKWDTEYIKSLISYYKRIIEELPLGEQYTETMSTINSLYNLLDTKSILGGRSFSLLNFRDVRDSDYVILEDYDIYFQYIKDFATVCDDVHINPLPNLKKRSTSCMEAIMLSKSFYSMIGGDFFKTFKRLESEFSHTINFQRLSKGRGEYGETYTICGTDHVFFDLGYNNTLQDYITPIHEFGHGISALLVPGIIFDENKYCFIETESLFFELLGIDYMGDKKDKKEALLLHLINLKDYIYSAILIVDKVEMYTTLTDRDLDSKRKISKYLKSEHNYDSLMCNDLLKSPIRNIYHYIVSYITAIELYELYHVDRDGALSKLAQIIRLRDLSADEYLEQVQSIGICLGSHLDDFLSRLDMLDTELNNEKMLLYKN